MRKLPRTAKLISLTRMERATYSEIRSAIDGMGDRNSVEEAGPAFSGVNPKFIVENKISMLKTIEKFMASEGQEFDPFNGLPPTRKNQYFAYEFTTLWIWTHIVLAIIERDITLVNETFCKKYGAALAAVFKKYPKITGNLIMTADLKVPGNPLLDYAKMEEADFDADHSDEYINDEKANEFKAWILKWCDQATEKDKMRVRRWFETDKSHKQIFAEINKVVGNFYKFNSRLALFVERLFNKQNLENFFSKSGFDSKEELFMAYFEKLTDFDEETKKAFIKKYLLG